MNLKHTLLATALIGALPMVSACAPEPVPAESSAGGAWGVSPAPGTTWTVAAEDAVLEREVPATVRSLDHIAVAAEVEGRVLQVHAELGDRVSTGQKLASLDPSALRSRLEAAQAALDLAEAEQRRVDRLVAERVASEREADAAASLARQARAHLELAQSALEKATVVSPVDAIVEAREVSPGDLAVPGKALFALYDPKRLVLEAQIPLDDRAPIQIGTELSFELSGETGRAQVLEIAPTSDPRSRTLRVRLGLDASAAHASLAPGSFGLVRYPAGTRARIAVPLQAVRRVGQLEMVLAQDAQGQWRRRAVRTGAASGEQIEILSGLSAGEVIGW